MEINQSTTVLVSGGWMNGQEPLEKYFERTGEIKNNGIIMMLTLSEKAISWIPEIEEVYILKNGETVGKRVILDFTYLTKYSIGKDSEYWISSEDLDLDTETAYRLVIDETTEITFEFNAQNNYGLQMPIEDIIEKCGVPNADSFTGLFAPGCCIKKETVEALPKDKEKISFKLFQTIKNEKEELLFSFYVENAKQH